MSVSLTLENLQQRDPVAFEPLSFSIGAVVTTSLNPDKARVALITSPPGFVDNPWGITDFSTFMRETPESGESADEALARGLEEELNVKGRIVTCLGVMMSHIYRSGGHFPKITLYRLVLYEETVPTPQHKDEIDSQLQVEWESLDGATRRLENQAERMHALGRPDLDEREPLDRARRYMEENRGIGRLAVLL